MRTEGGEEFPSPQAKEMKITIMALIVTGVTGAAPRNP